MCLGKQNATYKQNEWMGNLPACSIRRRIYMFILAAVKHFQVIELTIYALRSVYELQLTYLFQCLPLIVSAELSKTVM